MRLGVWQGRRLFHSRRVPKSYAEMEHMLIYERAEVRRNRGLMKKWLSRASHALGWALAAIQAVLSHLQ